MHLPKAVAASWRLREADMLNAADECPPRGGKADMDQPLLQNSVYEYTPNARLIETVWTDRAREAFSAACSSRSVAWWKLIMALQPPRKHRNLAATKKPRLNVHTTAGASASLGADCQCFSSANVDSRSHNMGVGSHSHNIHGRNNHGGSHGDNVAGRIGGSRQLLQSGYSFLLEGTSVLALPRLSQRWSQRKVSLMS